MRKSLLLMELTGRPSIDARQSIDIIAEQVPDALNKTGETIPLNTFPTDAVRLLYRDMDPYGPQDSRFGPALVTREEVDDLIGYVAEQNRLGQELFQKMLKRVEAYTKDDQIYVRIRNE